MNRFSSSIVAAAPRFAGIALQLLTISVALAWQPIIGMAQPMHASMICVVREGQISEVPARYNPSTGDTTISGQHDSTSFPATGEYAAAASWYINNEPIEFRGQRYVKYGLPRILGRNEVVAAGKVDDVTAFVEAGATGAPEVLYIPVRPVGCEFQPYQSETYTSPPSVLRAFQPWPPPAPSKRLPITGYIRQHRPRTFGEVANLLERAFIAGGYGGLSYYAVPGGFAVVTSFEQTRSDATPLPPPNRWISEVPPPQITSLASLLNAIFTQPTGYYRIAVITVTNQPYNTPVQRIGRSEAANWLHAGLSGLPRSMSQQGFTNAHQVNVLIYEFERANPNASMILRLPGRWGVDHHLTKAGVWQHILH